jgi:hypothetical protein
MSIWTINNTIQYEAVLKHACMKEILSVLEECIIIWYIHTADPIPKKM